MTLAELNAYQSRHNRKSPPASGAATVESDLHEEIIAECNRRGWLAFHGSMAHRTFRTPGEPDFVILTERGVALVECKTGTGKLSTDQQAVAAWAARLGHTVHVVRSFEEFLRIIQ